MEELQELAGKVAHGYHPHRPARRRGTQLSLCAALQRARHRTHLTAKNSLTATDAKLVEDAFERRLSELPSSDAATLLKPLTSAQIRAVATQQCCGLCCLHRRS